MHLTRADGALWRTLTREWDLPAQLASIDDKLEALGHAYGQLTTGVADRRARRLGDFVFVFTAAGVVSLGLKAADFTGLSGSSGTNVGLLLLFLLVAAAVWASVRRAVDRPAAERSSGG